VIEDLDIGREPSLGELMDSIRLFAVVYRLVPDFCTIMNGMPSNYCPEKLKFFQRNSTFVLFDLRELFQRVVQDFGMSFSMMEMQNGPKATLVGLGSSREVLIFCKGDKKILEYVSYRTLINRYFRS
jgi:hypothetical protein